MATCKQVADLSRFAPPAEVPGECPRQYAFVPRRPLPLAQVASSATGVMVGVTVSVAVAVEEALK